MLSSVGSLAILGRLRFSLYSSDLNGRPQTLGKSDERVSDHRGRRRLPLPPSSPPPPQHRSNKNHHNLRRITLNLGRFKRHLRRGERQRGEEENRGQFLWESSRNIPCNLRPIFRPRPQFLRDARFVVVAALGSWSSSARGGSSTHNECGRGESRRSILSRYLNTRGKQKKRDGRKEGRRER